MKKSLLIIFVSVFTTSSLQTSKDKTLPSSYYVNDKDEYLQNSINDLYSFYAERTAAKYLQFLPKYL